jgi:hypothetical protein
MWRWVYSMRRAFSSEFHDHRDQYCGSVLMTTRQMQRTSSHARNERPLDVLVGERSTKRLQPSACCARTIAKTMSTTTAKRAFVGKRLNRRIGTFSFPLAESKAG